MAVGEVLYPDVTNVRHPLSQKELTCLSFVSMDPTIFYDNEDQDGVRFTMNILPPNRKELEKCQLPLAALYTPLKPIPTIAKAPYDPVRCGGAGCKAFVNPYW